MSRVNRRQRVRCRSRASSDGLIWRAWVRQRPKMIPGGTNPSRYSWNDCGMEKPHRLAYSPAEFAALFGKHPTWAYRQLYKGTVKAITRYGRIMIPQSEAERVLSSATEYFGATDTLSPNVQAGHRLSAGERSTEAGHTQLARRETSPTGGGSQAA